MKGKVYLGDAVYLENDGYHWILTTENGLGVTDTIYLEGSVMNNLIENVKKENKDEHKTDG